MKKVIGIRTKSVNSYIEDSGRQHKSRTTKMMILVMRTNRPLANRKCWVAKRENVRKLQTGARVSILEALQVVVAIANNQFSL